MSNQPESKLAIQSKINFAALVLLINQVLVLWEIYPPDMSDKITTTVNLVAPVAIIYFRLFKTHVTQLRFFWQ